MGKLRDDATWDYKVESGCLIGIFLMSFVAFIYTALLSRWVTRLDKGTPAMQKIAGFIQVGANAFVRVQYTSMAKVALPFGIFLFIVYAWIRNSGGLNLNQYKVACWEMFVFFAGAIFSGLTGILGMWISVQSNLRAAAAATKSSDLCLKACFRGGAVSGMLIASLAVFGVVSSYAIVRAGFGIGPSDVPTLIVGLGFGASFIALFAQLGGGIYTKAADVGADLVGKVEKGMPEDDPRNPAVVADLVGDNVGDCAGRGADLYESMTAENIGAMILGASVAKQFPSVASPSGYILFPLVVHSCGLLASMIAILCVYLKKNPKGLKTSSTHPSAVELDKNEPAVQIHMPGSPKPETTSEAASRLVHDDEKKFDEHAFRTEAAPLDEEDDDDENPMVSLARGYLICLVIATVLLVIVSRLLLYSDQHPRAWCYFFGAGTIGIWLSWMYVLITDYYTGINHHPVIKIAKAGEQGHGPVVIHGLAVGMESTGAPVICIVIALLSSYWLGYNSGLSCSDAGRDPNVICDQTSAGIYGTACATMGMLITGGYILAMDTFGPISDNAGGIAEMSNAPAYVRRRTDILDAVGNTTKALTKGYAVGSAGLATFLLFRAFLDEVRAYTGMDYVKNVDLAVPEIFVSAMLGVCLVFFFGSLCMTAVGSAAQHVIDEVRRQLRADPKILTGESVPDYDACVAIVTKSALRQMILPGLLVVLSPIVWGLIMRGLGEAQGKADLAAPCLAAFLMTVTIGGVMCGLFLNNAGGAWDNAKKLVATGKGWPGKHSESHSACVTGDTVGDPCKDTAGPSLHVCVKLVSTVVLVLYPIFVRGA